jgi:hypothetical protein
MSSPAQCCSLVSTGGDAAWARRDGKANWRMAVFRAWNERTVDPSAIMLSLSSGHCSGDHKVELPANSRPSGNSNSFSSLVEGTAEFDAISPLSSQARRLSWGSPVQPLAAFKGGWRDNLRERVPGIGEGWIGSGAKQQRATAQAVTGHCLKRDEDCAVSSIRIGRTVEEGAVIRSGPRFSDGPWLTGNVSGEPHTGHGDRTGVPIGTRTVSAGRNGPISQKLDRNLSRYFPHSYGDAERISL